MATRFHRIREDVRLKRIARVTWHAWLLVLSIVAGCAPVNKECELASVLCNA